MSVQTVSGRNLLPKDLVTETFSYLALRDLAVCCRTSTQWQQLAKNQKAWSDLLEIPYDIGRFIIALKPDANDAHSRKSSTLTDDPFAGGPDPSYHQMRQGLRLIMTDTTPGSISTRYGALRLYGAKDGNYAEMCGLLQTTLGLTLIEQDTSRSLWAIRSWNGRALPEPIEADGAHFIPYDIAKATCEKFQAQNSPPVSKKRKIV